MASHSRGRFSHCIDCAKPKAVNRRLSVRGLCEECAIARMLKASGQMQAKEGPYYEEWLRSMRHASRRLADQYGG